MWHRAKPIRFVEFEGGCQVALSHAMNHDGYFRKMYGIPKTRKTEGIMMHRAIYEYNNGPIPEGYEIDHICRNRACCNPEHLQIMSISEHKAKTNRQHALECNGDYRNMKKRSESAKGKNAAMNIAAKDYWLSVKCTPVQLAKQFNVTDSTTRRWIKEWRKRLHIIY